MQILGLAECVDLLFPLQRWVLRLIVCTCFVSNTICFYCATRPDIFVPKKIRCVWTNFSSQFHFQAWFRSFEELSTGMYFSVDHILENNTWHGYYRVILCWRTSHPAILGEPHIRWFSNRNLGCRSLEWQSRRALLATQPVSNPVVMSTRC